MFYAHLYVKKRSKDQSQLTLRRPGHILEQQRYDGLFQVTSKSSLPLTGVRLAIPFRYTAYEDLSMNECKKTAQKPKTNHFETKKKIGNICKKERIAYSIGLKRT